MKKFFTVFFVTLGVIFLIILIGLAYLYIADPFNIKPLLFGTPASKTINANSATPGTTTQSGVNVSSAQKAALESAGIKLDTILSTVTPAQEACFTEKVGAGRVAEIKAGAVPTLSDILAGKACVK